MIDQSQFIISKFEIRSKRFQQALEISPVLIVELNIYESIRMPFLTGNFLMVDDIGLRGTFGIYGNEELTITLDGPAGSNVESITKEFMITAVEQSAPTTDRESVDLYTIIEKHAYLSEVRKVSQSFKGKGEDIIKKMLLDFFDVGYDNRSLPEMNSIQGSFRYVAPFIEPLEAVEIVRRRISSPNGTPYYLYSTLRNPNLVLNDFESIFSSVPWNVKAGKDLDYIFSAANTQNGASQTRAADFFYIQSWKNLVQESVFRLAKGGGFGSQFEIMEINSGQNYQYRFNAMETIAKLANAGRLPGAGEKGAIDQSLTTDNSLLIGKPSGEQKHLGEYNSNHINTISAARIYNDMNGYHDESQDAGYYKKKMDLHAIQTILNRNVVNITVAGTPYLQEDRSVGNLVRVLVPKTSTVDASDAKIDEKLSGDYIISDCRHIFGNDGTHKAAMDIMKMTNREGTEV